jgi:hypothetical protein
VPQTGDPTGVRPFGLADRNAAIAAGFPANLFDENLANGEAGNYLVSRSSTADFRQDAFVIRTDHLLRDSLRLSVRYAQAHNRDDSNSAALPGTGVTTPGSFYSPAVQLIYTPSASQVLELRGSVMRRASDTRILEGLPDSIAATGVSAETGISIAASGVTFRLPSITPFLVRDNQTIPQFAAQHSWTLGGLILRTGAAVRRIEVNFRNNTFPTPVWQFTGLVGANGLLGASATAQNAVAASARQTAFGANGGPTTPQGGWISTQQEYYTQADWRVHSNLTFNLGLRYSYFGVYREKINALSNLYAEQGGNAIPGINPFQFGRLANRVAVISDELGLYRPDRNNFQPRLGVAWSVRNGTVLRAAYGLYFDRLYQIALSNLANNVPYANSVSGANIPFTTGSIALTPAQRPVLFGIDPAIRNPYLHRYNVAVEQQLFSNIVVTAAYVASTGRKLIRTDEPNLAGAFPLNLRPDQRFSDQRIIANLSSSDYDSLQLTAQKRFGAGLFFSAAYTYSSYRDDSSTDFFAARPTLINLGASAATGYQGGTQLAPRPVTADYGRSENDAPHVFVTSFVYELPVGKGRRWGGALPGALDTIIGGWSLAGLLQIRSGPPFDITLAQDVNDDGYLVDRPALASGSIKDLYNKSGDKTQFLLPLAQATQRLVTPANVTDPFATIPRHALRGDRTELVDLSLLKRFSLRERLTLGFECNVFNALNHANFAVPNSSLGSSFFGTVTSTLRTTTPRQIQLGLRLVF